MYRKFREDPSSVDASWHEFLVDYSPEPTDAAPGNGKTATQGNSAPTAPPEPAPAPAPKTAGSNGTSSSASKPAAKPEAKAAPKDEAKDAKSTSEAKPKTESKSDTKSDAKAKSAAKQENAKQDSTASAKAEPAKSQPAAGEDENQVLRGAAAAVAKNMSASLEVPTATSVRAIPAKAMIDNRIVINNHLKRTRGGKISFTHLLGYAIVQAVKKFPNMNRHFTVVDGKPNAVTPAHTNLGLAIDLPGKGGQRALVVAAIKNCETMTFGQFIAAYEDIVRRARDGKLTAEDFSGVTISLTNPGTIGTVHSVPRLMQGQGAIIGAGAMEYPAEFQGASEHRINEVGVGKLMTLTSTYDHRIIQGAESGDFLRTIHQLLLDDDFYDEIFRELGIPYEPVRWRIDNPDPIE
ncbi:2-oxo acid dehydrogenase subunit E2, partial [Mycolicibacterium poriferae]